jgi:predicted dinucleotide-binding enzyme
MRIAILGHGPLAAPLEHLAERAGHTARWTNTALVAATASNAEEETHPIALLILAGSRAGVEPQLAAVGRAIPSDAVIVDATIPIASHRDDGGASSTDGAAAEWIKAKLPRARIVRAFASVPADALIALLQQPRPEESATLAVPLAGDDKDARQVVAAFMRDIGVEPFDLGALGAANVIDPGGPLWRMALSPLEMTEAVGWLSGDG